MSALPEVPDPTSLGVNVLEACAELLRVLPRERGAMMDARRQFESLKHTYSALQPRLICDVRPASNEVDYEIFLCPEAQGTLRMAWSPDRGIPWTPQHGDHWAANYVCSVNGAHITIQSALIYLNGVLTRQPRVMQDLVDRLLTSAASASAAIDFSDAELDEAVDQFRMRQGLHRADAMRAWLAQTHLTMDALRGLVAETLAARKFREGIVADGVAPYFAAHAADFDRLTVLRVNGLKKTDADTLAEAWRTSGQCPILDGRQNLADPAKGTIENCFARDLPSPWAAAQPGDVVGPCQRDNDMEVGQLMQRKPATLDDATRQRIATLLFDAWLAERRAVADVHWHWV